MLLFEGDWDKCASMFLLDILSECNQGIGRENVKNYSGAVAKMLSPPFL